MIFVADQIPEERQWALILVAGGDEALYKVLMNINESGCRPYGMAWALMVIDVSV